MAENKEYLNWMKESAKNFIDGIDIDTGIGKRSIEMIYGFTRKCFLKSKEQKDGTE